MNILVTGGLGFIGHNVVARLEKLGHNVFIVDYLTTYGIIPDKQLAYLVKERLEQIPEVDVSKLDNEYNDYRVYNVEYRTFQIDIASPEVEYVFRLAKPDIVIHLASFPRQKVVNNNPVEASKSMITGLLNLCELSKKYGVSRFVYISSSMVYGDFTDSTTEDHICKPIGQYGIMKLAGEQLVKDYARKGELQYTIIRPSAVYGPRDVEDRVMSKFLLSAMRGETIKVNGPNERLDFTYVDDVADGIVSAILSNATANKCYNVTRGASRTLLEAAEIAVKIAGKGKITIEERDMSFPSRGALSIEAAKSDFGFNPTTDIEEGSKLYYEYLQNSLLWSPKTI